MELQSSWAPNDPWSVAKNGYLERALDLGGSRLLSSLFAQDKNQIRLMISSMPCMCTWPFIFYA